MPFKRREIMKSVALGVIHDVVQPLMALSLYVDAIAGEHIGVEATPDNKRLMALRAKDAVARINRIASSLSSIGKKSSTFRPHEVVEDCIALLEQRARAADVRLQTLYRSSADQTILQGERGIVCISLLTVIANAITATRDVPDGLVLIEVDTTPQGARIRVLDTGHGITTDPFDSVTYTPASGGMGVGLSTAREVLRATCNADIVLFDEVPVGFSTCFDLLFERTPHTNKETPLQQKLFTL
jgi:signal transduction histidine kinase